MGPGRLKPFEPSCNARFRVCPAWRLGSDLERRGLNGRRLRPRPWPRASMERLQVVAETLPSETESRPPAGHKFFGRGATWCCRARWFFILYDLNPCNFLSFTLTVNIIKPPRIERIEHRTRSTGCIPRNTFGPVDPWLRSWRFLHKLSTAWCHCVLSVCGGKKWEGASLAVSCLEMHIVAFAQPGPCMNSRNKAG